MLLRIKVYKNKNKSAFKIIEILQTTNWMLSKIIIFHFLVVCARACVNFKLIKSKSINKKDIFWMHPWNLLKLFYQKTILNIYMFFSLECA